MESEGSLRRYEAPISIEIYRRRARLRRALGTIDEAIELARARVGAGAEPTLAGLEQMRDDLQIALWLAELGISRRPPRS